MDTLHTVLRAIKGTQPETTVKPDHLTVFREFLAHLNEVQRKAAKTKPPRVKSPAKRKSAKRGK